MDTLPNNLPKLLRKHGLKVKVVRGWRKRRTSSYYNGFNPAGVACHHTATGKNWTDWAVQNLLVKGRQGLSGPLSQLGLQRDGTVLVIGNHRANHAGKAKSVGTMAAGDGNYMYIGIEAFNDGVGEPWGKEQYDAYVLLVAVLCVFVTKNSVKTVVGHKEISTTGKVDPTFNMDKFRADVEKKMDELKSPKKPKRKLSRGPVIDQGLANFRQAMDFAKKKGWKRRARLLQAGIDDVEKINQK